MFFKPVYILILGFTIVIDYVAGIYIEKATDKKQRKRFLVLSIITNVGVLAIFKYFNFFNDNITSLASFMGLSNSIPYLNILLPIGLSFHTFQAMSYTIEVYRGNQKAERHFGLYALYVMFYPQLVAGPIERPQNTLPQLHVEKKFDYGSAVIGLRLMLWGFFKKMVIADNLSIIVDNVYNNPSQQNGFTFLIATYFFTFQIYCDFSGYSDIAMGSAKIMGFDLMKNFNIPYISKSIKEFWERWHISLSSWFRDYLYIPLGGNRVKKSRWMLNLFIVFLVSGFWHGANWTFIVWGALHGTYLILEILFKPTTDKLIDTTSKFGKFISVIITFHLAMFAWVFFRANSIEAATFALKQIFTNLFTSFSLTGTASAPLLICTLFITAAIFYIVDFMKENKRIIEVFQSSSYLRYAVYLFLIYSILLFGNTDKTQFIYFQF
jgi:D-alanyl-lipoteichoic acid acyltransferase DltB (MBOAT superfamily)